MRFVAFQLRLSCVCYRKVAFCIFNKKKYINYIFLLIKYTNRNFYSWNATQTQLKRNKSQLLLLKCNSPILQNLEKLILKAIYCGKVSENAKKTWKNQQSATFGFQTQRANLSKSGKFDFQIGSERKCAYKIEINGWILKMILNLIFLNECCFKKWKIKWHTN